MKTIDSPQAMDGVLLVNKPEDRSSNAVLQILKRLFHAKKAGHTGSLDPLATGMLPICFGQATKFSHFLLDANKGYTFTLFLGAKTVTGDREGDVVETATVPTLTTDIITAVLNDTLGKQSQIPPMYSALKQKGQPLYALARAGKTVERPPRNIDILSLKLLDWKANQLTLETECSKGTYIRVLAETIAEKLGTVGHTILLHRNFVAPFDVHQMVDWETITDQMLATDERLRYLLPVDTMLVTLPEKQLLNAQIQALQCGQIVQHDLFEAPGMYRLYSAAHQFIGIGELTADNHWRAMRMMQYSARNVCD